jgi:hypothetical protein
MPFTFPDEKIEELRVICERQYGRAVSTEEARVTANNLLELYRCFCELARKCGVQPLSPPETQDQFHEQEV